MTPKHTLLFGLWALLLSLPVSAEPATKPIQTPLLDSIVAVVDDGIILKSELDTRIKRFYKLNRNRQQKVPPADVVRRQMLEQIIVERSQLQLANRTGIKISDAMVNTSIERLAKQNKLPIIEFRSKLEREFGSYQQARESIREQIMLSQLRERQIGQSITITDDEVDFFLEKNKKKSDQRQFLLRHILIALPSLPSEEDTAAASQLVDSIMKHLSRVGDFKKIAMAHSKGPTALEGGLLKWRHENELPTLLNNHISTLAKGKVLAPIRTPGGYHIFKVADVKGGPTSLVTKYKVRHILIKPSIVRTEDESKTLAEELRAKALAKPDEFSQLAKTYSDDPGSAKDGGVLEDLQASQVVSSFKETMLTTPINNISQVFKTEYGWHFLQVLEKRQEDVGSKVIRQEARHALYRQKFEEKLIPWMRKVRQEAYVDVIP